MPSRIDEEPIFIGLSTESEFFADLDEEPQFTAIEPDDKVLLALKF